MLLTTLLGLVLFLSPAWSEGSNPDLDSDPTELYCPQDQSYYQNELIQMSYPDLNNPGPVANPPKNFNSLILQRGTLFQPLIKVSCSEMAMRNVLAGRLRGAERRNRFIVCDKDKQIKDFQNNPCLSAEYKLLMKASFEIVTKCLKEFVSGSTDINVQNTWVEAYFKLLSTESGLHVNAASDSGATGAGQLTGVYIANFKNVTLGKLRRFLAEPKIANSCRQLGAKLLSDETINSTFRKTFVRNPKTNVDVQEFRVNMCENVDITNDQPLLNLLISFANLQQYRQRVVSEIINHPKYKNKFKLSPLEMLDLEVKLVSWSYNLGSGGLRNHIWNILDTKYRTKQVTNVKELILNAELSGKRKYLLALEDRYKVIKGDQESCRTDLP